MPLRLQGYIDLPPHVTSGGFDHAAVHGASSQLFVAHTANDALDVIDCERDIFVRSVPDHIGIAGALVSDELDLVFTSNRGDNSVSILSPLDHQVVTTIPVGVRPNGLACDPVRRHLLAANVGDPSIPGSCTLSLVDIAQRRVLASIPVAGRTRWTLFNPRSSLFYVNIGQPAQIAVIDAETPTCVSRLWEIPAAGPHGLDLDAVGNRLFCACDAGVLLVLDSRSGEVLGHADLSGTPDVIFFNAKLRHLYVAIGDPGLIDVFDTDTMTRMECIATESGAHTMAFDAARNKIYAFLPQTHRASVYHDQV